MSARETPEERLSRIRIEVQESSLRERLNAIADRLMEEGRIMKLKVKNEKDLVWLAENVGHDLTWLFPNLGIDNVLVDVGNLKALKAAERKEAVKKP